MFVILSINLSDLTLSCWAVSFLWTRFYNNAAQNVCVAWILCIHFGFES